jgi:hypothetical protein
LLLGKLAPPAQSINFYRAAEQCERSQARLTFEKLVDAGDLDVLYPPASDTKNVVVGFDVAVVARGIVQERDLAGLAHFAKLFKNPMDCGQ